jgi:hypothetical protein
MQKIEGRLLRQTNLILVSSPDYDVGYFDKVHGSRPPRLLVENKVLEGELPDRLGHYARPSGPPWRIGWFGALRCRESLLLLADLVTNLRGQVEVDVRGTPSTVSIPDFHDIIASTPHMTFYGPYDRSRDLQSIYSQVHFAWSIDRFEKGMNSDMALSNRLYEGSACGAIIIAEASVAMGRWLRARGTGVLVQDPILPQLTQFFEDLDTSRYRDLADAAASLPASSYLASQAECRAIVDALMSPRETASSMNAWSRLSVRE